MDRLSSIKHYSPSISNQGSFFFIIFSNTFYLSLPGILDKNKKNFYKEISPNDRRFPKKKNYGKHVKRNVQIIFIS